MLGFLGILLSRTRDLLWTLRESKTSMKPDRILDCTLADPSFFPLSFPCLSSKDLQFIHPCIADLKTYVQLAPPPPPDKIESSSTSSPRSNNHNNSKDNPTFEEDPHSVRNRQFAASLDRTRSSTFSRTTTPQNAQQALNGSPSLVNGTSNPSSPAGNGLNRSISSKAPLPSYEHLTLTLAQNQLSSLPSALFEVTKLTVLSLSE